MTWAIVVSKPRKWNELQITKKLIQFQKDKFIS